MQNNNGEIYSLLMPASGDSVLLPNAAVAEVVPFFGNVLPANDGAPAELLGYLQWRGRNVPLLATEVLKGEAAPQLSRLSRIAILNTLNAGSDLPNVAIVVGGIPRLTRVTDGLLNPLDGPYPATVKLRAQLGNQTIEVPDIDALEEAARELEMYRPEKR